MHLLPVRLSRGADSVSSTPNQAIQAKACGIKHLVVMQGHFKPRALTGYSQQAVPCVQNVDVLVAQADGVPLERQSQGSQFQ